MATADYRLCDACSVKVFYDVDVTMPDEALVFCNVECARAYLIYAALPPAPSPSEPDPTYSAVHDDLYGCSRCGTFKEDDAQLEATGTCAACNPSPTESNP